MDMQSFIKQYKTLPYSVPILEASYRWVYQNDKEALQALATMDDPLHIARHASYERYIKPRVKLYTQIPEGYYATFTELWDFTNKLNASIIPTWELIPDDEIATRWSKEWDSCALSTRETKMGYCYPEDHPCYGRAVRCYPKDKKDEFYFWLETEYLPWVYLPSIMQSEVAQEIKEAVRRAVGFA